DSLRSEMGTPCSMYGTRGAVTQRSAPERSIRLEVVVVNPRNNPSSTTMSTTANTMPVTVTPNRTLSCTRLRQPSKFTVFLIVTVLSNVQKKSAAAQPLDQHVEQPVDDVLRPAPLEARDGDEERRDAVDGGPEGAARDQRIRRRDLLAFHARGHDAAQNSEALRAHPRGSPAA